MKLFYRINNSRLIKNSLWAVSEKIIQLISLVFLIFFLSKKIGPELFGVYNYANSIYFIFSIFCSLGLNSILVEKLIVNSDDLVKNLYSAIYLRFIAFLLSILMIALYTFYSKSLLFNELIWILSFALFFQPFDTFESYYISIGEYITLSKLRAISYFPLLMSYALSYEFNSVKFIASGIVLQKVLFSSILIYKSPFKIKLLYNYNFSSELLLSGLYVLITSSLAIIYMKADLVIIEIILGIKDVGLYSVAALTCEALSFFPFMIINLYVVDLIKSKETSLTRYHLNIKKMFSLLLILGFIFQLLVIIFGFIFLEPILGIKYSGIGNILFVYSFSIPFMFARAMVSKWGVISNNIRVLFYCELIGLGINIIFNILLLPALGVIGAAYSTVLAYIFATFVSLFFLSEGKEILRLFIETTIHPIRYLKLWLV